MHLTITDFVHTAVAKHLRHGRADLLRPVAAHQDTSHYGEDEP